MKLSATIAETTAEDVARQTLAVNAHEDRVLLHGYSAAEFHADPADTQRQMWFQIDKRRVGDQIKVTQPRRQLDRKLAMNKPLPAMAELDEILDGAHLNVVPLAEIAQFRQVGHVAVGAHDLANDSGLLEAGEACQVDAALGVAGANQNTSFAGPQTIDMAISAREIVGAGFFVNGDGNRPRAIECRCSRGNSRSGIDGLRERGFLRIDVGSMNRRQMETFTDHGRHGQANDATSIARS